MTPEQLCSTLGSAAMVATMLAEDAAASADRALADAVDLDASIASATDAGVRGDLVEVLASVRDSSTVLADAAIHIQTIAEAWQVATRKAAAMAKQHVALQAAGAAGEFYQGAPATPGPAGLAPAIADPLKLADRFELEPDETFVGSASTKDGQGSMMLAAAVDTPDGRVVHIAVPVDAEDRKRWRGASASSTETVPYDEDENEGDEEGEDGGYDVDTYADTTTVIDAAAAAALPAQVEELITAAQEADAHYRKLAGQLDKAYNERQELEAKRFGDSVLAGEMMSLDARDDQHTRFQKVRRVNARAAAECLDEEQRARYDALQERLDAAGQDRFEPGAEAAAAEILDLTPAQYQEMLDLERIDYKRRTTEQQARLDELFNPSGRRPALLAEQVGIVLGLSVDEVRELERLKQLKPHEAGHQPAWRRTTMRTADEERRYAELWDAPGGVTGRTAKQTRELRRDAFQYGAIHLDDKVEWTNERIRRTQLEAQAGELSPADAARLAEVSREHDALSAQCEALGGWPTATVEVPGLEGDALVVEAVQREEYGGVDYRMAYRPADADEDWSPGSNEDPYRTTAGGLRKAAATVARLGTGTAQH